MNLLKRKLQHKENFMSKPWKQEHTDKKALSLKQQLAMMGL